MSAAPGTPAAASRLISPEALLTIRSLELRARVVVEGFWSGLHRSPYHGFSVEFTEYREYSPGDDPRYLDWKVYGRSDRYCLKKFEDETNLRCLLLVDQSRSMTYGSGAYTKAQYAATLAATLGYFLHQQGDATGLLTFDESIREYLPARHRTGHLRQLMHALEKPAGGRATDLVTPVRRAAEIFRKRGMVVMISDFLAPIEALDQSLTLLAAAGHEVCVFQVLDPREARLDLDGPLVLEDLESGRTVQVDPAAARPGYLKLLEEHTAAVRGLCGRLGASWQRLTTDEPLERALHGYLQSRGRPSARMRRAGGEGGGR